MDTVLVVDDEAGSRQSLRLALEASRRVLAASSAEEALDILDREDVKLILLDIIMPGTDGLELLKILRQDHPGVETIVVSASTALETAIEAMKRGASDYLIKPYDVSQLRLAVNRVLKTRKLKSEVNYLRRELGVKADENRIVGSTHATAELRRKITRVAMTTATVLVTGESGTGKDLVARNIHLRSARRDGPFIPIHCAAIPDTLLESELFGHEKGAYTGATAQKRGRFELADSGTLFLDEIAEMPLPLQAKMLRVLETHSFTRVGGTRLIEVDTRIIVATNRVLRRAIDDGKFREDLYYRINVVPIQLLPLRDRKGDIPVLADHFLSRLTRDLNSTIGRITPEAMERLEAYRWPGNARELRNVIERIVALHLRSREIALDHLPDDILRESAVTEKYQVLSQLGKRSMSEIIDDLERLLITEALRITRGVQTRASKLLGITRRVLKYRIEKLNIAPRTGRRAHQSRKADDKKKQETPL